MDEQERVIQELERALNAKINPLKLAETRLENRKMRPHMVRAHHMFSRILNFLFVIDFLRKSYLFNKNNSYVYWQFMIFFDF